MIMSIYRKAGAVVAKKPLRLWGISLLSSLLTLIITVLFGTVLGVALAINLAITTAMTIIYLRGYRGEVPRAVDLFACLKDAQTAKHVIGGMAWMMLWIFLWALIPVVGWIVAIVKAYSYRLTPYILVNEPHVPATKAIKVSQKRTYGYRGKMFGADILIYVLLFVVSFVLGLLSNIPLVGSSFLLLSMLLILAAAVLTPLFLGLVQAAFYEEIMAKLSFGSAMADDVQSN